MSDCFGTLFWITRLFAGIQTRRPTPKQVFRVISAAEAAWRMGGLTPGKFSDRFSPCSMPKFNEHSARG